MVCFYGLMRCVELAGYCIIMVYCKVCCVGVVANMLLNCNGLLLRFDVCVDRERVILL